MKLLGKIGIAANVATLEAHERDLTGIDANLTRWDIRVAGQADV
jgi:hypothetical protein